MPKVVPGYKAQARARIVQAGLAIFSRRGFRRTTMADIAKEVGVSKGDLYLYFPSKIDLLAEIQSASQRESRELMARSLARKEAPEALIEVFESMVEDPPGPQMLSTWFEVLAEASSDPRVGEVLRTDHRADLRLMKGFLRQSRKQRPGGTRGRSTISRSPPCSCSMGRRWSWRSARAGTRYDGPSAVLWGRYSAHLAEPVPGAGSIHPRTADTSPSPWVARRVGGSPLSGGRGTSMAGPPFAPWRPRTSFCGGLGSAPLGPFHSSPPTSRSPEGTQAQRTRPTDPYGSAPPHASAGPGPSRYAQSPTRNRSS